MRISTARKIAYEVLRRVEAEGAYASDVLHDALDASVKPADAALATEITLGVLRWQRLLDLLASRHLKKPNARLDPPVAIALRMGIYQLRYLRKIPVSAAVNESVELVKAARKASAAPLVNAVLHKAADEAHVPVEGLVSPDVARSERLAILDSHPTWMVERWISRMGEAATIALMEANNARPRLSCALQHAGDRAAVVGEFEKRGMRVEPGLLLKDAFAVSGGSPARTDAFRSGMTSIQDEASQAVPLLLGVSSGDRVLDLCAAPGGKTPPLARAAGATGLVVATDRHAHRLKATRAQFERLRLGDLDLVELDAEQPLPFGRRFDRILVDAPCSGTGTLARHPEIRWSLRAEQLNEFHRLQVRMLRNALANLAPGGRLVYSTCSIEPEENEEIIAEALRDAPSFRRASPETTMQQIAPHLAAGIEAAGLVTSDGYFRTSPAVHHTDGFFAALIEHS